jgi:hypothetical protein
VLGLIWSPVLLLWPPELWRPLGLEGQKELWKKGQLPEGR